MAAGREAYGGVFGHPERFEPFSRRQCEKLLYVHVAAYERVTGTEWRRLTRYDYESYTDRDGWPDLDD
ncbi:hypothetical protein ACWEQL_01165 [Kitasatospora sp. NPDC004240]